MPSSLHHISLGLILGATLTAPALSGPPYLTDDPQPTDPGHWEIYNFLDATRGGDRTLDGEAGFDLNYGAARDLQLTAVLPLAFDRSNGLSNRPIVAGTGVIELGVKYEFLHQAGGNWTPDVSAFPRALVPTDRRFGPPHVNLLLPMWAEKDSGPWQVFGGGGYQINPGSGRRDFWEGGLAFSRTMSTRLSLGAEVYGQTRDSTDDPGFTAVNFIATCKLVRHWSLLVSSGPTWRQGGGHGQILYFAFKADY